MSHSLRVALMAATLAGAAVPQAVAADVTPEQARTLEGQIRAWMQLQAGPGATLDERPVQVAPDGDRYRIAVPFAKTRSGAPQANLLTALVRPDDSGRWTIDDWRFPASASFTGEMPAPPKPSKKPAGAADGTIPVDYTLLFASQDNRGFYDPSFATSSTLSTSFQGFELRSKSAVFDQVTKVERSAGITTLRPSGLDRVDLITDTTLEGYTIDTRAGDASLVEIAARRVRVGGEVTALSRERTGRLAQALTAVGKGLRDGTSVSSGTLRAVLPLMQDLASAVTLDQTMEGLSVKYGPFSGTASQARLGVSLKSDGGLLRADMDLGLDGLALPDLQMGAMAELLPRRIALHPVLTGVPADELVQLLIADREKAGGAPPDVSALLRRGTVGAGLESFALDIGGASFAGMGKAMIASPEDVTGEAQVTAVNFDLLMQRANAMPELAGALPVLVFAKGIGHNVENRLVWDITYRRGKMLVNGTDLSSMMGSKKK